jgi:DNA-binding NtrC family response regulator
VIVLTGQNDQANALRAVAMGAYDFFAKPFEPELLGLTIDRAFRLAELQAENRRLQAASQPDVLGGLITRDQVMLKVCRMIERVASSDATVMLMGESGTGKEVLAQGLHQASKRTASSSRSTAQPFLRTCWRASCSVTNAEPSQGLPRQPRERSNRQWRHALPRRNR